MAKKLKKPRGPLTPKVKKARVSSDPYSLFSLKPEPVELVNGSTTYLRKLSAAERYDVIQFIQSDDSKKQPFEETGYLLCRCLCEVDGTRLFTDGDALKVPKVIFITDLATLALQAMLINAIGAKGEATAKKKSLNTNPTSDSSANSPAPSTAQ